MSSEIQWRSRSHPDTIGFEIIKSVPFLYENDADSQNPDGFVGM